MPRTARPSWLELATPDLERAAAFYGAVLGWTLDDDGDGVLARRAGHEVARLRAAEDGAALWSLYFAVDDADAACEQVVELGGSLLHEPEEAPDGSVRFLALDPGGAEFGGIEVGTGSDRGAVPDLVGADALSGEPGQARTFYERLLGFRFAPAERGATITDPDGEPVGTLDIAGDALPHWRPRLGVADLEGALGVVVSRGGSVVEDDPHRGTALVRDDAGLGMVLVAGRV